MHRFLVHCQHMAGCCWTTFYYLSFPLTPPSHSTLLGYTCSKRASTSTQPTQTPRRTRTKATLRTPRRRSNASARSMTRARSKAIRTYRTRTRTWPCRCCVPRIYHCCKASKLSIATLLPPSPLQLKLRAPCREISSSQQNFFRMLDKKIDEVSVAGICSCLYIYIYIIEYFPLLAGSRL